MTVNEGGSQKFRLPPGFVKDTSEDVVYYVLGVLADNPGEWFTVDELWEMHGQPPWKREAVRQAALTMVRQCRLRIRSKKGRVAFAY